MKPQKMKKQLSGLVAGAALGALLMISGHPFSRIARADSTTFTITSSDAAGAPATGPSAHANASATQPSARSDTPATQPAASEEQIKALIAQLGDDDYKTRESATQQLSQIGKPAVKLLKEATASKDLETADRARQALAAIDAREHPKPAPRQNLGGPGVIVMGQGHMMIQSSVSVNGGAGESVSVSSNGANTDATVQKNGVKATLHTGPDGLKMAITENGKTKEYAAKDVADLKKSDPEAYKLYDEYFSKQIHSNVIIQLRAMPAPQPPASQPDAGN